MALESAVDCTRVGDEARFLTEPLLAAGRVRESFLACCWYPLDAEARSDTEPVQNHQGRVSPQDRERAKGMSGQAARPGRGVTG